MARRDEKITQLWGDKVTHQRSLTEIGLRYFLICGPSRTCLLFYHSQEYMWRYRREYTGGDSSKSTFRTIAKNLMLGRAPSKMENAPPLERYTFEPPDLVIPPRREGEEVDSGGWKRERERETVDPKTFYFFVSTLFCNFCWFSWRCPIPNRICHVLPHVSEPNR